MSLYKIKDYAPDYQNYLDNDDIIGFDFYSRDEKIGSVDNILVDDNGQFRYLVVNTGVWVFGKKVLLPIGYARIDSDDRRVYADTLTKEQVKALPEYNDDMTVNFEQEEAVRKVYRSSNRVSETERMSGTERVPSSSQKAPAGFGVGYGGADSAPSTANAAPNLDLGAGYAGYDGDSYTYDRDPDLYDLKDQIMRVLRPIKNV